MGKDNKIKNTLFTPLATSAGKTFQDVWDLVFGPFHIYVEKKRVEREKDLEDFKNELCQNFESIPDENLIDPKLSTIGPILEASKYYYEDETIRKLFSKLLASAMDNRVNELIHPSFIEKIKQMSPLDAQNLSLFSDTGALPIADYRLKLDDSTYEPAFSNVFLSNYNELDLNKQAASIENLVALGFLQISYEQTLADDDLYKPFFSKELTDIFKQNASSRGPIGKTEIRTGTVSLTHTGTNFLKVCYSDS